MRKIIYLGTLMLFCSCDPEVCTEEKISNSSDVDIVINWFYIDSRINNRTVKINKNTGISDETCAMGGVIVNYNAIYDSVVVKSPKNKVLKVWTSETKGRNIYNIDRDWVVRKTSKNHFVYTFEITNDDLGLVDEHID